MQTVWNTLQRKDFEKLQSDVIAAHDTYFSEHSICTDFLQNFTYINTLFSVVRESGSLGVAILSKVYTTLDIHVYMCYIAHFKMCIVIVQNID